MSEENKETNKPVFKVKAGNVEGAVWEQEGKNGKFLTVSTARNYKDGEEWKKTNSLRINDLPQMQLVLEECYKFAKLNKQEAD